MFVHIWCLRSNGKRTCVGTYTETAFLQQLLHKEGDLGYQINQFEQNWGEIAGQLWKRSRV